MKISTTAFVLKTSIFKESSLIVRLFTLDKGKVNYIIKAAMRQKPPNNAIFPNTFIYYPSFPDATL